jgi:hypothetical protein
MDDLYRAAQVNLTEEADALMADLLEQAATLLDLKEVAE